MADVNGASAGCVHTHGACGKEAPRPYNYSAVLGFPLLHPSSSSPSFVPLFPSPLPLPPSSRTSLGLLTCPPPRRPSPLPLCLPVPPRDLSAPGVLRSHSRVHSSAFFFTVSVYIFFACCRFCFSRFLCPQISPVWRFVCHLLCSVKDDDCVAAFRFAIQ